MAATLARDLRTYGEIDTGTVRISVQDSSVQRIYDQDGVHLGPFLWLWLLTREGERTEVTGLHLDRESVRRLHTALQAFLEHRLDA